MSRASESSVTAPASRAGFDPAPGGGAAFSCATESWPGPGAQLMVLRIAGEIDLLSYPRLRTALDAALFGAVDQPTRHLVIDLAGVSFCRVRGLSLLVDTAVAAAATATGYALSGCPSHLRRYWRLLCAATTPLPPLYVSVAAAVIGIRAGHTQRPRIW